MEKKNIQTGDSRRNSLHIQREFTQYVPVNERGKALSSVVFSQKNYCVNTGNLPCFHVVRISYQHLIFQLKNVQEVACPGELLKVEKYSNLFQMKY